MNEKNVDAVVLKEKTIPFFKKKWFLITLAVVVFLAMIGLGIYLGLRPDPPEPVRAIYVYGDYEYEILEDDTISILAYTGDDAGDGGAGNNGNNGNGGDIGGGSTPVNPSTPDTPVTPEPPAIDPSVINLRNSLQSRYGIPIRLSVEVSGYSVGGYSTTPVVK